MEKKLSRKTKLGQVVSNKMDKTVVVRVDRTFSHPQFSKVVTRFKKYYAHTDQVLEVGQKVKIVETRPLSKLKRWRVVEVV
ncbi:MAG: 30S ribosomal protein S17 [Simkaniaceae bacterium]|nr:30S ribosomal protein S17 [Simkaniaceae bacterium]MCF7851885.1 30S ribosomal protein S17 [Simkaniaceae bacterium]